jgi:TonB family protein
VLVSAAVWSQAQNTPQADAAPPHLTIANFGLVYPLSNEWLRATELIRSRAESANPAPNFDILLAAVYLPKSHLSADNPFFSLRAYRQPATDCKRNLEAMIAQSQDKKDRAQGGVEQFSAAGRDYFRVNLASGVGRRHQSIICTAANSHLLIWDAGAPNEKGMDAIVETLNSITALPQQSAPESSKPTGQEKREMEAVASKPVVARPERVRVSSGVTSGLLIKKVAPIYPADARAAHIQGTIKLQAEISKAGDITDLELIDGPIELAGSAVAAVRQWKYKPYLLMGEPVIVQTTIQVNYELR